MEPTTETATASREAIIEKRRANMAKARAERARLAKARKEERERGEQGGVSELGVSAIPKRTRADTPKGNKHPRHDRVQGVQGDPGVHAQGLPAVHGAKGNGAQARCGECVTFDWVNTPLRLCEERIAFLSTEQQKGISAVNKRESEMAHREGCSICGRTLDPLNGPKHWQFGPKAVKCTCHGIEKLFMACSLPCYYQFGAKIPWAIGAARPNW